MSKMSLDGSAHAPLGPPQGILQLAREHRRRDRDGTRTRGREKAHENPRGPVFSVPEHDDEDDSSSDETEEDYRAGLDGSQRIYGPLRERPRLSHVAEQTERAIKRHEERNAAQIHIRQEGILEVDFEGRGIDIPAFEVRFPQQEGKSSDADEHHGYLKQQG